MINIQELTYQIKHRIGRNIPISILAFLTNACKDIDHALNCAFSYDRAVNTEKQWKSYDW